MSSRLVACISRARNRLIFLPLVTALLAAGAVVFITQQSAAPAPAAAATSHKQEKGRHGAGITIGGEWFGVWKTSDGDGFCIEFDKDHPNSSGAGALRGSVPGMSAAESERVKYVANHYGKTRSNTDAAAASIFVWKTQNTGRFNSFYAKMLKQKKVPASVQKRLGEITREAANHGPYKLSMKMGSGLVGQSITGSVTVKAKNGKVVPNMAVVLTARSNGSMVKWDKKTSAKGTVAFTTRITRIGAVRVDAKLTTAAAGGVWITRPSAGHQRLVLAGKSTEAAVSTVSTQRSIGGPKVASACDGDCLGVAPVTVDMSNPCGSATVRQMVYVDGKPLSGGSFDVAGCTSVKKTYDIADDAVVTTRYCYLDSAKKCTSTPVTNAGSLKVVCPEKPMFRYTVDCPCAGDRTISYQVQAPPTSRRAYTVTLTVTAKNGTTWTRSLKLTRGWQSLPTATIAKGSSARLTVTVLDKTTTMDSMTQTS